MWSLCGHLGMGIGMRVDIGVVLDGQAGGKKGQIWSVVIAWGAFLWAVIDFLGV